MRLAVAVLAGTVVLGAHSAPTSASAISVPRHEEASAPAPMARRGCHWLHHTRPSVRRWATRVVRLTDLTCREARYVWRNEPSWRNELPTTVVRSGGAVRRPSPAVTDDGAQATHFCDVWTVTKYRAPTLPFGHHVLWSVRMDQSFGYDNASRVTWVSAPRVTADTTANGFRWHADGAPWGNDWWVPAWAHVQHHTERFQKMTSVAIPNIGNTHSVATVWNWKQWNGDWSTSGDQTGLAGCRDDD